MNKSKITSFQEASDYLGSKQERPYANNTRIERVPADSKIVAKYHGHTVAEFYEDGWNSYSSCGWKTMTTKERINWFLPRGFNLYQSKSVWQITDRGSEYEYDWQNAKSYLFEDGITVNPTTREVTGAGTEDGTQKTLKLLRTFVKNYVQELVDGKIDKPSNGDCWYCLMQTEDGKSLGEASGNTDHILSHFRERYYVPSLLVNAFKFNHRISLMAQDGIARLQAGESISDWQKEVVSRDVKSCLTAYLKHCLNIAQ